MPPEELERWKKALMQPAPARVYHSGVHNDARMHLGGIGAGNIEIGVDGQFTNWQLFNTLRDGYVPLMFAVKAGGVTKLLQTAGGPDWPRVKQIEMTGEYPIATLRYLDPDLPVKVELSAFTPFAPLDTPFSSQPLAVLLFRIQNPTTENQIVSLAGMLQNAVGYDAIGPINGVTHGNFGGNVNEPLRDGPAVGLSMRAEPGKEPSLDKPVTICNSMNLQALEPLVFPGLKNLAVTTIPNDVLQDFKIPAPSQSVIWFEEPAANFSVAALQAAKTAVQAGATLVFSGKTMPLLEAYALHCNKGGSKPTADRPLIVFDDFETGYGKWKSEGKAFGQSPAQGTLPGQNPVADFQGKGLVNSFVDGDDSKGRLVSQPFTIERNFIRFLVGGGSQPSTQIRLVIDGKTVHATSGRNDERLLPSLWDVREFAGKKANFEIVDDAQGGWAHINVDQIEFLDSAGPMESLSLLQEILPAAFTAIRPASGKQPMDPNALVFENLQLQPDGKKMTLRTGFDVLVKPLGKGRVVLAAGAILDPSQVEAAEVRNRALDAICELAGANYTQPQGVPPLASGFGTMALVALADNVTVLPAFDDWNVAWKQFESQGSFLPLDQAKANPPTAQGRSVDGAVAATVTVPAGGSVEVPFLLAWSYPNKYSSVPNYGQPVTWIGCHYATLWPNAKAVIHDAAANLPSIRRRTESFRKTFYDSTLPYWLLDCMTSQAAIIRHNGVVFQIANGDIYGWEGSNGCCNPTCTHVWGYEQSLARLFPDLERDMRRIDFKHQQRPDGGVNNRTIFPSPAHPTGEGPATDGHASCILKAYREALNSSDDSFFKEYWPEVKKAVEYLINRDAATSGGTPDGTLEDDQHNTYDQQLHGVTTFLSGYYLAALRAGEEWAKRMGDTQTAERFHGIFLKGQENLVKRCWNGEYFQQDLPGYENRVVDVGGGTKVGELGPGCLSDQLIGQWWAHQLGLGYILPKDKVQAALRSIFKYNWLTSFVGFKQMPRVFVGDNDKGLLICTWPKGGRPKSVMLYSDEVWTGIEYQVAAHMIYEGMLEEGYAIVKGVRDRYDGIPRAPIGRNPWNEIECGGHYARAMASWSLLLALSGYEYDGIAKTLCFMPRITPTDFKSFFSGPEGWGSLRQIQQDATQRDEIQVVEGRLAVATLRLAAPLGIKNAKVTLNGVAVDAALAVDKEGVTLSFATPIVAKAGDKLEVALS
jgi:uncharacterized protein (DUF608 family)